jgi:hypothetical protein
MGRRKAEDERVYTSMFLLEEWSGSPQPCGCKIERCDDNPKEAIASLCTMHTFAPWMYDALVRIAGLRGTADEPPASTVAGAVLGRIEEVRLMNQESNERAARRVEPQRRKQERERRRTHGP